MTPCHYEVYFSRWEILDPPLHFSFKYLLNIPHVSNTVLKYCQTLCAIHSINVVKSNNVEFKFQGFVTLDLDILGLNVLSATEEAGVRKYGDLLITDWWLKQIHLKYFKPVSKHWHSWFKYCYFWWNCQRYIWVSLYLFSWHNPQSNGKINQPNLSKYNVNLQQNVDHSCVHWTGWKRGKYWQEPQNSRVWSMLGSVTINQSRFRPRCKIGTWPMWIRHRLKVPCLMASRWCSHQGWASSPARG